MPSALSSELGRGELGLFELGSVYSLSSTGLTISQGDSFTLTDHVLAQLDFISLLFSDVFTLTDVAILSGVLVSLTQSAADTLNAWSDAISQVYRYLSTYSDTLTFTDQPGLGYNYLFDEDSYHLSDVAQVVPAVLIAFGDSAHNWLDLLTELPNISFGQFEDNFLITDELKVQLHHKLAVADLNTLSDAILLVFRFLLSNSDTITLTDAASVSSNALGALTLNISETLDMSDSLGGDNNVNNPLRSDSFINYLRRYLNDVPR